MDKVIKNAGKRLSATMTSVMLDIKVNRLDAFFDYIIVELEKQGTRVDHEILYDTTEPDGYVTVLLQNIYVNGLTIAQLLDILEIIQED